MLDRTMAILWPDRCGLCDRVLPLGRTGVCRKCFPRLSFVTPPYCMGCGKELAFGTVWSAAEYCPDCERRSRSYDGGIALLNYDGAAQKLLIGLKYENKREYARFLARETALRRGREIRSLGASCLIPVPIHPRKRRERGFNQAGLLAKALGKDLGIPVRRDVLVRTVYTTAQKKLGYEDRQKNEAKAFQARKQLSGTVILVDDIYTTGATAQACTTILKNAGAERVFLVNMAIGCGR